MAKSPIQRSTSTGSAGGDIESVGSGASEPRTPRAPRQRTQSRLDGLNLRDVMKARAEQDRVLKARLKQIDSDIAKLMDEHEQISEILGIKREDVPAEPSQAGETEKQFEYTCADCGRHDGPNARGDCAYCGAGPFEQAK